MTDAVGAQAKAWFMRLPLTTRAVTLLCLALYCYDVMCMLSFPSNSLLSALCNSPAVILHKYQLYRLLTANFLHLSFLHIVLNLLAFQALAPPIENKVGSITFFYDIVCCFAFLSQLLHLVIATMLHYSGSADMFGFVPYRTCSAGLSAVLFALLVLRQNSSLASNSTKLFGMIEVPSKLYPWILLVVMQLLFPRASLLGHLSGIIVGYLYIWGWLDIMRPSAATFSSLETSLSVSTTSPPPSSSSWLSIVACPTADEGRAVEWRKCRNADGSASVLPIISNNTTGHSSSTGSTVWSNFRNFFAPISRFRGDGQRLGYYYEHQPSLLHQQEEDEEAEAEAEATTTEEKSNNNNNNNKTTAAAKQKSSTSSNGSTREAPLFAVDNK
ncbi:SET domain-containing protein [Balamuthia mandrillaris]